MKSNVFWVKDLLGSCKELYKEKVELKWLLNNMTDTNYIQTLIEFKLLKEKSKFLSNYQMKGL